MAVPILKQGSYLIASIQSALTDGEVLELRDDLADRIGRYRSRGIIIDVAALDVIDSFVARSLRTIARTAALRGAATVIVGIQPDVAVARSPSPRPQTAICSASRSSRATRGRASSTSSER